MSSSNGTLKACGACKQEMARSAFSKKQWERKKFRRCKGCVDNETPFQRPSKKDYPQENDLIPPETELLVQEKPQVVVPDQSPLDPLFLDESHLISDVKPAEIPLGIHTAAVTTVNIATVEELLIDIPEPASSIKEHEPLDRVVLSESTKSNSGTAEVSVESTTSVAIAGDENTVQNSKVAKVDKAVAASPPTTPKDQPTSDASKSSTPWISEQSSFEAMTPARDSRVEVMVQEHESIFRAVFDSKQEERHRQQEAEQYDDDDDLQALHRVSTDDVMEYEVEPIVNVEQEIYELLNASPSSEQGILFTDQSFQDFKIIQDGDSPSSAAAFFQRTSPAKAEDAFTSVPATPPAAVNNEEQALEPNIMFDNMASSTEEVSPPDDIETAMRERIESDAMDWDPTTALNHEEQIYKPNIMVDTTASPTDEVSQPPADIETAMRERIESDAMDWDPSAMASLSPTMPSSPPPEPPIEMEDVQEDDMENREAKSFRHLLAEYSLFLGYACGANILGVILSALLFPQDHAVMLVFAGLSVILATLMLVADLVGEDGHVNNKTSLVGFCCFLSFLGLLLSVVLLPHDHGLLLAFGGMAAGSAGFMLVSQLYGRYNGGIAIADDSLREPLLSGAEDREIISEEV